LYLLYAPPKKFGFIPPSEYILTPEVRFYRNVALCIKQYWAKIHIDQGCIDITPRTLKRIRKKRPLFRIAVVATGGIGDSLWNMPFIRFLRGKYPNATIFVITEPKNKPVWLNFPYTNQIVSDDFYNMHNLISRCDEVYYFGGVATMYKKYMKYDPVEAIFLMAGEKPPQDKKFMRPHIVITIEEGKRAEALLREKGADIKKDKIISIGTESSTNNRNWPIEYIKELSKALIQDGYKVVWLGKNEELSERLIKDENRVEGVINLVKEIPLRTAMSIISLSDLYIGPNSSLMIIAASLEIPTIGLFGAFHPKIRTKFYIKFKALYKKIKCSPCNEHWTECPYGHPAPCMKVITPKEVYLAAKEMLKKYPREVITKLPIE